MSTIDTLVFKSRGPLAPGKDDAITVHRPEFDQVLRFARSPQVDAYVAVLSSRQTGKTTLLYQMCHALCAPAFATVLIDLGNVHDQTEAQLYNHVARSIRNELFPDTDPATPLPNGSVEFQNFMREMAKRSTASRIVIMLDEVEAVPAKLSDGFFGTFRTIFSMRFKEPGFAKYLVILSGARALSQLTSGSNSPLNIAERIYLSDFTLGGVKKLVANFEAIGIIAPPETADWIFAHTKGHPYLTQMLCAKIAEHATDPITEALVDHCACEILRGDDHLEKMIADIEGEPKSKDLLGRIVAGDKVQFSRLHLQVARLELSGAICDAGMCAVRNKIYDEAFKTHFNIGTSARVARVTFLRARPIFLALMLLIIAIHAPLIFFYTRDVTFGARKITAGFNPDGWGISTIVRYDNILRPTIPATITVDLDYLRAGMAATGELRVTDPDLLITDGNQKKFPTLRQPINFIFLLNQDEFPYNPFDFETERKQVDLVFRGETPDRPSATFNAEFVVDRYSVFVKSLIAAGAGLVGLIGAIWGNLQKAKSVLGILQRLSKMIPS